MIWHVRSNIFDLLIIMDMVSSYYYSLNKNNMCMLYLLLHLEQLV